MTGTNALNESLTRWQRGALIVAVVGLALCGVAVMTNVEQFLRSYLAGFLFWWSVTMGCLGLLMLYYLVGGYWGEAVKPLLECGSQIIPLTAVLFLPVALGIQSIYPWAGTEFESPQKALYLNPPFFYGRAVVYFLVWSTLALLLRPRPSETGTGHGRSRQLLSAGGLVVFTLTVTFAAIDWAMSLDPAWYSSIYGAAMVISSALTGMALVTLTLSLIQVVQRPIPSIIMSQTLGDLGALLLAFLMLWAYFAFSQLLIVWSGNLPEENVWYVNRLNGGWQWMGLAIVILQFVVPFFLLLSHDLKQNPRTLAVIAMLVFVMQYVYFVWTLSPSFHPWQIFIHWTDLVAPVAIGGLWTSAFLLLVRRRVPQLCEVKQS